MGSKLTQISSQSGRREIRCCPPHEGQPSTSQRRLSTDAEKSVQQSKHRSMGEVYHMGDICQVNYEPSFEAVAQASHFFIATTLVLGLCWCRVSLIRACLYTLAFALLKEFTFDLFVEHDSILSSCADTVWYSIGTLAAFVFLKGTPRASR